MDDGTWFVVGLGNPGPGYAGNRHNVGHVVLDEVAGRAGATLRPHRSRTMLGEGRVGVMPGGAPGPKVIVAKTATYMNVSGGAVAAAAQFFKIPVERVLVVHDELDLPFGALKLKRGGGEGGHNGLRDVTTALGSREYIRARVGIGRPPGRMDAADYVLRDFTVSEQKELPFVVAATADAVELVVRHGLEHAQLVIHTTR